MENSAIAFSRSKRPMSRHCCGRRADDEIADADPRKCRAENGSATRSIDAIRRSSAADVRDRGMKRQIEFLGRTSCLLIGSTPWPTICLLFRRDRPLRRRHRAGLHYVSGDGPGIRRVRCGKGFRYLGPHGKPVKDERDLARIRSLAIPPAWTEVWICPPGTATSRPPAAMPAAASSTAITPAGARCATRPSTAG